MRAPTARVPNSSHTDTSKVNGVFCSTTSSGPIPYSVVIHRIWLTTEAWATATPFGRPVEPEVKIEYAVFDGRNGATRSASVTGSAGVADRSRPSIASDGTDAVAGTENPSRSVVSTTTGAAVSRM